MAEKGYGPVNTRLEQIIQEHSRRMKGEAYGPGVYSALLSCDGSIFQIPPAGVVYPACVEDVVETVELANRQGLTLHPRGAGSGLCGSALGRGLVVDFSRHMNQILSLDEKSGAMTVQPGVRGGEIKAAAKKAGLFFPPDPSSGEYATIGGMFATNASGSHSIKYGNTADYVTDAQLVTADGEVIRLADVENTPVARLPRPFARLFDLYEKNKNLIETAYPHTPSNTAGYNLRQMVQNGRLHPGHLFGGSEGSLGMACQLTLRLLPAPAHDSLVVARFSDIYSSCRAVNRVLDLKPSGIEIMDRSILDLALSHDPSFASQIGSQVNNILMMEFDGDTEAACAEPAQKALEMVGDLAMDARMAVEAQEKNRLWSVRKAAVPLLYKLKGEKKVLALVEDATVPTDKLAPYFKGFFDIMGRHGVDFVVYGHIAKGLMHNRPLLNLKDPADVALLRPLADEVFDLVNGLGGTISGEHGDGRLRSIYLKRQYPRHPSVVR